MPFHFPGTEVYGDDGYRVVWSPEEFDAAIAEGWSESPLPPLPAESSPVVLVEPEADAPTEIPVRKCGNCGETGHNRATCPNKAA